MITSQLLLQNATSISNKYDFLRKILGKISTFLKLLLLIVTNLSYVELFTNYLIQRVLIIKAPLI